MFRYRGSGSLVALAVLLLVVPSPVPVSGSHGTAVPSIAVCGRVVNEAGWVLADLPVTAIGRGTTSADHVPPPAVDTGADGRFRLFVLPDRYEVVLSDDHTPQERAGASYEPRDIAIAAHLESVPGACAAARGIDRGDIVLLARNAGFIEVTARDAITSAILVGATVTAHAFGLVPTGHADTDPAGFARVACTLNAPATVVASETDYDDASSAEFPCIKVNPPKTVAVWRTPVDVTGVVRDGSTSEPLEDALARATPQTLVLPPGHPYVLEDATDGEGAYALAVPWTDTYELRATLGAYGASAILRPVTNADIAAGLTQDFSLARTVFGLGGQVTGLAGAGIPATLTFTGPEPSTATQSPATNPDGTFAVSLAHGAYDLSIASAGKNTRACDVTIDTLGAATIAPDYCFMLLASGTGAVRGTARDELFPLGVPGASVEAGASSTVTGPTGGFALETAPGMVDVVLRESAYNDRTVAQTVDLDVIHELGSLSLTRRTVQLSITARDAGSLVTIANARVCHSNDGALTPGACANADAAGLVTFNVKWSRRASGFDAGNYAATGQRTTAAPLYDLQTCLSAFDVFPAGASLVCLLAVVPGIATSVGPLRDAHNAAALGGVLITASSSGVPCDAPYVCSATTGPGGTATLSLPSGRVFTVTASHGDYQAPAAAIGVVPGTTVFAGTQLARESQAVDVSVLDAHTGYAVQGAVVTATGQGFACDPGFGGFDCSTESDGEGTVTLQLPWGALTFASAAEENDVIRPTQPLDIEAGVSFAPASRTLDLPADGGGSSAQLRLLRGPGAPIAGTLKDTDDAPVADVTVRATTEAADLDCNPALHDGPPAGYPDCAGKLATGSYSLVLPDAQHVSYTWTVHGTPPEPRQYFDADETGAREGDVVDLVFWSLFFDLTVSPTDAVSGDTIRFATVCVLNLDDAIASLPAVHPPPCPTSGPEGGALVFEDVGWQRSNPDDETDRFLVTGSAPDYLPAAAVMELGPATNDVQLLLVPIAPSASASIGVIQGRVTDASVPGGSGVPGALVTATPVEPCPGASAPVTTLTLHDGGYVLPVPCTGDYTVSVQDVGRLAGTALYGTASATVTVEAFVVLEFADLIPQVPAEIAQQDFALTRTTGTIKACMANLVASGAGAIITVSGLATGPPISGTTGPDGCFSAPAPWDAYRALGAHPNCIAVVPGAAVVRPGAESTITVLCVDVP